jgi:Protein of unknown function, DUF547
MTDRCTTVQRALLILFSALLAACAAVPRPVATDSPDLNRFGPPPYDAWSRVLSKHVDNQGRVNFVALARDRADLDRFVSYVYDTAPNNRPNLFATPAHVLAFHINAYNALAMHKVLESGIPHTLAGFRKVGFFYFGKVQVGGEAISLYDYENVVIRALGEPRIHVALNCMSIGCPQLPREVFVAEKLEQQLDREAKIFFNEVRNVEVDSAERVVRLSEILKFYTEDFLASAPSLAAYVSRYRSTAVPEDFKVEFIPYDWTINRQPSR